MELSGKKDKHSIEDIKEALRNAIAGKHPRIDDANLLYNHVRDIIKFSKTQLNEIFQECNKSRKEYEKDLLDIDFTSNKDYCLELEGMEYEIQNGLVALMWMEAYHSMNCISNIAPLIECIFVHTFDYIRENIDVESLPENQRWNDANKKPQNRKAKTRTKKATDRWNCHYYYRDGEKDEKAGIAKGCIQLLEAIGIRNQFPDDTDKMLTALFAYRNNMFHNGYEWPKDEKEKFIKRAQKEGWQSNNAKWFNCDVTYEESVTMSDFFIDESLNFARNVIHITIDICNKLQTEKGRMDRIYAPMNTSANKG